MSSARHQIQEAEYHVTWQEQTHLRGLAAAWHAPNRAQNLRSYFTGRGVRVIPRVEQSASWEFGLELTGYGRAGSIRSVSAPVVSTRGNRITYDRGGVVEWYLNDTRGLEQGFTLAGPPEERGEVAGEGALVLELTLSGDLSAFVSDDAKAIDLTTPAGARALRYAELSVVDAMGRALPARMEVWSEAGARGIRLLVDDDDAVWPVTVDPLLTSLAWTAESNQAGAFLGASVATAGDVNGDGYADVIVGAYAFDNGQADEGRAFVYHGSATGLSVTPGWTAESDQASALFGYSVGTAGDVNGDGYADVIVGARFFDNGQTNEGRAFVYHGSATGLFVTPAWAAESDQASADFGASVGTAGDVNGDGYADAIVGAPLFDNGQTNEGRAFVYHGSATGLSVTPGWTAESDQASAAFGLSVGTAGDVNGDGYADVIVGAYNFSNGETNEGRAFVYHGAAMGLSSTPGWTTESDQEQAWFGYTVGTAGDVNGDGYADVIVGALFFDNGQSNEGRAFVYHGAASGLSVTPGWTAESDQLDSRFGSSVGTAGDVNGDGYADVIVGAQFFSNGQTSEGRAFVYHGAASGLSVTPGWTAESDQLAAEFGISVGTAGDVNGDGYADVIVGAYTFDNGQTNEGRAFVYHGAAMGLSSTSGWTAESDHSSASFGLSAGTAGDVNGDGYADVIVGASAFDNGQPFEGRAFVYHGAASGLSVAPDWTAESDQAGASFGGSVGTAGDVNGDGYADVIVAAGSFDNGQSNEGRAFVYHGSGSGLSLAPNWTAESNQASASFGRSVGTAGDVNGDGYADVIVGAFLFDNNQTDEGRAFVYHGSVSGLSLTANWTAEGDQADAQFGVSVGTAGDVNGDGYADLIVGARGFDNGSQPGEGRAFVYHGSGSGLSSTSNWAAESNQVGASFGNSVGTAGDVNGDGYADVIVGADFFDNVQSTEGWAFVYHGSASGLGANGTPLNADWTAEGDQAIAHFGYSVGTAGDVNGDGYADVIVGAYSFDNDQSDEGRAFVYHGSASGLSSSSSWTAESNQGFSNFGSSVGTAGDVNGDGYADVIVGASLFDNGQADEGRVFIYYGNGGPGPSLRPQQRRGDDAAPISPLGASESPDSFRLSALGRTPFGRGLVKLEWEVKPLGLLFNGASTQLSAVWTDTGSAGASLNELVGGLSSPAVYHWRVRLRYHPATTPLESHSRWVTVPWNGWQEGDVRTLPPADLSVLQTEGADPVFFGGDLTYTVHLSNAGPQEASFTTLRDTVPLGTNLVAAVPTQGTCGPATGGDFTCNLGSLAAAGSASVSVTVRPVSPGSYTNTAEVSCQGVDPDATDNLSTEMTTVLRVSPGDRAWEDSDGDGVQDPGEPGVAGVLIALYDGAGLFVDATVTDAAGAYIFPNQTLGETYRLRFIPPSGYVLTAKDQGADDALDSDADPITQLTPAFVLVSVQDPFRWDAGLIPTCLPPDEAIFISGAGLGPANETILTFQDFNQPAQVTGYNVYRSDNLALPPATWPLVASDIVDGDTATPNNQWADTSGDPPPGGIWYYNVTAWNSSCNAEGPF
jgi:uncharacterized repeat protein (TIGR01451 family)